MAQDEIRGGGLKFWSSTSAPESPPEIDIVAVQGLGANPYYTWVKKTTVQDTKPRKWKRFGRKSKTHNNDENRGQAEVMWPRDLLVPAFQNARVATYSYGSDWRDRKINTSLRDCGQQLLEVLLQHREGDHERQRPLILIGHSLGGLVIQQALVIAVHGSKYINLRLSIAGIIFLGAPFQGSDAAAYGQWLARLIRFHQDKGQRYTLLETLKKDSPSLHDLSVDFWRSYGDYDAVCFWENSETNYGSLSAQFVTRQSATLIGKKLMYMDTDHSGLNKFSGRDDKNFRLLLPEIQRMANGGPSVVADRYREKAVGPAGNVHWTVPRPVNSLFTGRSELLDRIQGAFRGDESSCTKEQKRLVITGMGGQGKSEVCLKVANLMRENFWGVFWVDVGSPSTANEGFIVVAKALGISFENVEDSLRALASTKRSWLLILDNADDPQFDYSGYIPPGTHGAIIITSRIPNCSQYSTIDPEALEGLDLKHSTQLLLKAAKIPKGSWFSYKQEAEDITSHLGSHTLALIQVGAYVAEGHCQLGQYLDKYQLQRKRLLRYHPDQEQSRYRDIYATFEASAEVLGLDKDETGKDALDLLAILSMLHYGALPLELFKGAWRSALTFKHSETDAIDAVDNWHISQLPAFMGGKADEWDDFRLVGAVSRLSSLSLVTRQSASGSGWLSMHPLTHAWAKDRMNEEQQQQAWLSTGSVLALSHRQREMWSIYERQLQPHVQSYLVCRIDDAFCYGPPGKILPIVLSCGWMLVGFRDDLKLESLLKDICRRLRISPVNPSRRYLPIWDLAARSAINMGNSSEAVQLLEYIIKIRETLLAETHPDRLASQHNLASAYKANGQIQQAVELLEHVVKVKETILAETHPSRLASQHTLASAYKANGQIQQAVELLEHVVKVRETILAETHPSRLVSQHTLASAYKANGQIQQAVELLEHVVKVKETILAETHPDRLASQHTLASTYKANGQIQQAVELLEHVVKVRETIQAETHPDRLASQHTLASTYKANGQIQQAVELLEHVVKVRETILAETHPDRIASEDLLASMLQANKSQ